MVGSRASSPSWYMDVAVADGEGLVRQVSQRWHRSVEMAQFVESTP